MEVLDAGAVGADVVGGPAAAEVVAAGGQLPDEVMKATNPITTSTDSTGPPPVP
jgi:hypothetical protein